MIEKTIVDIVKKMEDEDSSGDTVISKYVNHSMRETIEKIDAYLNSKHISGDKDSMGRDKPFFNIVTSACNIWYRATDLDRKDIKLKATKKADYYLAFILNILLSEWMRKSRFGVFLNDWGRVLARYGSAVTKFVEKNGELIAEVIPWNRMICDPINFEDNIKIEKLWLTPEQLKNRKEYDQDMVDDLLDSRQSRETMDGQKSDNKSEYIEVYEVHGRMEEYHLTDNDDDTDFVQQMHVVTFLTRKEGGKMTDDFTLYRGREKKDPYRIDHLIKEDGRTLAIGAVEHLFESQWMQNHTAKLIKDQLDLASKLIFQTSDGNFVGQNALNAIETGDILIHAPNSPLTEINNTSHDISALQNYGLQWKQLGNEINGIAESMLGIQAKSGTAWRQTQAELQEAHSLFELMTENKGLAVEDMLRDFVIPHLIKKMDTAEEISAILDDYQIKKLDSMFVPTKAINSVNKKIKKNILSRTMKDLEMGNLITPEQASIEIGNEQQAIQTTLNSMGNQRFIKPSDVSNKTWKQITKDFEWDVQCDITGENEDTQAMVATLTTLFQSIVGLQGQPMPPELKVVYDKILTATNAISPVELTEVSNMPRPMQPVK